MLWEKPLTNTLEPRRVCGGSIKYIPIPLTLMRRRALNLLLQSWRKSGELCIRDDVLRIATGMINMQVKETDTVIYTDSFQIAVHRSLIVTPRSFLTIVHHGLISVIIMSSETRGRVAGSSLAVNGRSLSRASGLKPPVCPDNSELVWSDECRVWVYCEPVNRLNTKWNLGFAFMRIGF